MNRLSRCGFIPKGYAKIAQGFNLGKKWNIFMSPEGTAETIESTLSAVPSGLGYLAGVPNVQTLGYCRPSRRDESGICLKAV
jgi:hypothetical protein